MSHRLPATANLDDKSRPRPLCYHRPVNHSVPGRKTGYTTPVPPVTDAEITDAWLTVSHIQDARQLLADRMFTTRAQVNRFINHIICDPEKRNEFIDKCRQLLNEYNAL